MYDALLKSRIISKCKAFFSNICKLKSLKLFCCIAQRCSVKKCFLKNFAKLTRKHLFQNFFLIELQVTACNFIKRETLVQLLSSEFSENFDNTFFIEHLWRLLWSWNKNRFLKIAYLKIQTRKKNETIKKIFLKVLL